MTVEIIKDYSTKVQLLTQALQKTQCKQDIIQALLNPCLELPVEFKHFLVKELETRTLPGSIVFLASIAEQLLKLSEQKEIEREGAYYSNSQGPLPFLFFFDFLNKFLLDESETNNLLEGLESISVFPDGLIQYSKPEQGNLYNEPKVPLNQKAKLFLKNFSSEFQQNLQKYNNDIETVNLYTIEEDVEIIGETWTLEKEGTDFLVSINENGIHRTAISISTGTLLNYISVENTWVVNQQFLTLNLQEAVWFGVKMNQDGDLQIVYGNSGVCVSRDFGITWTKYDLSVINRGYVAGNKIVLIADSGIIYEYNNETNLFDILIDDKNIISAGLNEDGNVQVLGYINGSFSIVDYNSNVFTSISSDNLNQEIKQIALYPYDENVEVNAFMGITYISGDKIFRGTIYKEGVKYSLISEEVLRDFNFNYPSISVSSDGVYQIISHDTGYIYSTNKGLIFTEGDNPENLKQVVISGNSKILLGSNGSIYSSVQKLVPTVPDNVEIPTSGVSSISSYSWNYIVPNFTTGLDLISSSPDGNVLIGASRTGDPYLYKLTGILTGNPQNQRIDYFYGLQDIVGQLKITDIAVSGSGVCIAVSTTKGAYIYYGGVINAWIEVSNVVELNGRNKHFLSAAISEGDKNGKPALYAFGTTKVEGQVPYMIVSYNEDLMIKEFPNTQGNYNDIYITKHNNIFVACGQFLYVSKNEGQDFTEYGLYKGELKSVIAYDTKNNNDRQIVVLAENSGNYIYNYDIKVLESQSTSDNFPDQSYLIQDNGKKIKHSELSMSGNGGQQILSLIYDDNSVSVLRSDDYDVTWYRQDAGNCLSVITYKEAQRLYGVSQTFYQYKFTSSSVSSVNTIETQSSSLDWKKVFPENFLQNTDLIASSANGDTVVVASSTGAPYIYQCIKLLSNTPEIIRFDYFVTLAQTPEYSDLKINSIDISGKGKCIVVGTTKSCFIYSKKDGNYKWTDVEALYKDSDKKGLFNRNFLSAGISVADSEGKPDSYAFGSSLIPGENPYMITSTNVENEEFFLEPFLPELSGNFYDIFCSEKGKFFATPGEWVYISDNDGTHFTQYGLYRGQVRAIAPYEADDKNQKVTVFICNGTSNYISVYNPKDFTKYIWNFELSDKKEVLSAYFSINKGGSTQFLSVRYTDLTVKLYRSDNQGENWYVVKEGPVATAVINRDNTYYYGCSDNLYRMTTSGSINDSTLVVSSIESVNSEVQRFLFGGLSISLNDVENFEQFKSRINEEEQKVKYFSFCNHELKQYFEIINV